MSYFVVAISNGGGAPEQAYRKMQNAGACPEAPYAEMFKFEVPSLMVGTLDSLMVSAFKIMFTEHNSNVMQTLSDELIKTDKLVESIVRKVENTANELAGRKGSDLTVGGVPAPRYIQQFAWDYAKYPNRRPLKELVALISGGVTAIDEELKQLGGSFAEKTAALQDVKRKKGGNLMVTDLNDVLNENIMNKIQVHDSEYLKTVFIAIPKNLEETFNKTYENLGSDIVGYGGPDWSLNPGHLGRPVSFGPNADRYKTKGSPVVPGSKQLVHKDQESILYAVTILKSQYEVSLFQKFKIIYFLKFQNLISENVGRILRRR